MMMVQWWYDSNALLLKRDKHWYSLVTFAVLVINLSRTIKLFVSAARTEISIQFMFTRRMASGVHMAEVTLPNNAPSLPGYRVSAQSQWIEEIFTHAVPNAWYEMTIYNDRAACNFSSKHMAPYKVGWCVLRSAIAHNVVGTRRWS